MLCFYPQIAICMHYIFDFNTKTRRDCLRGSISCLRFVVELFDLVVRLAGQVYTELAVDIRVNL